METSRLGGRPWIMPSATATQLGASRRTKGNSNGNGLDKYCADIQVNKELGPDDAAVMRMLIQHLTRNSPRNVEEAPPERAQRQGEWVHLRSRDSAAQAGRVRLYLSSHEEVQRVYQALHGQVLQVGPDKISIKVTNDGRTSQKMGAGRWAETAVSTMGCTQRRGLPPRNSLLHMHVRVLLHYRRRSAAPLLDELW